MANIKEVVMTSEGFKKLQEELEYLKTEGRDQAAEKIRVARGFGDLSENSEYDEAKNDQALLEARIAELEAQLKHVRILDESEMSGEHVHIGCTVTIKDKKGNLLTKETNDCLFYYMDDDVNKIRYYFLDDGGAGVFDQSYIDQTGIRDTGTLDKVDVIPFEEQLKWMKYTATQGEDPLSAGWGVVALEHNGFNPINATTATNKVPSPTGNSLGAARVLKEIEQAIAGVDAICILSAHTHYDGDYYNEAGGFYSICTSNDSDTRSGTTHFLPELGVRVTHSPTTEINTNNRNPGTDAEQLLDILQIDRENRKVYLTRLGDGFSRTFSF